MIFGTIFLIIMYLIFKYVLAWITYVNSLDSRLGESTWRWTYDYQVLRDRDYSDLDDKDFIRLRRRKNKLVTIMYSIFLIMFVAFMSWLSKFLIIILNQFLIVFYFSNKELRTSKNNQLINMFKIQKKLWIYFLMLIYFDKIL